MNEVSENTQWIKARQITFNLMIKGKRCKVCQGKAVDYRYAISRSSEWESEVVQYFYCEKHLPEEVK
jgi:hypothetical protein